MSIVGLICGMKQLIPVGPRESAPQAAFQCGVYTMFFVTGGLLWWANASTGSIEMIVYSSTDE